jgi:hypothetical protein
VVDFKGGNEHAARGLNIANLVISVDCAVCLYPQFFLTF